MLTSVGAPAVLVRVSVAVADVGVVVEETFDVTATFVGLRPAAVAVLTTAPASTSAWVITYGAAAVQVVVAPAASTVAGQLVAPTLASVTATPVIVSDPVLVTAKE
ncbi:hypothetical protein GCM10009593_29320 [Microlunatus antarcticus]